MSVKDINKKLVVYSALTGCPYFSMSIDDYKTNGFAKDFFYSKIDDLIVNDEGCIIKLGYEP